MAFVFIFIKQTKVYLLIKYLNGNLAKPDHNARLTATEADSGESILTLFINKLYLKELQCL